MHASLFSWNEFPRQLKLKKIEMVFSLVFVVTCTGSLLTCIEMTCCKVNIGLRDICINVQYISSAIILRSAMSVFGYGLGYGRSRHRI